MTHCYDEGTLRAYLDHELPTAEQAAIAGHLADCVRCQHCLDDLRSQSQQVWRILADPVSPPDPYLAFQRLQESKGYGRDTPDPQPVAIAPVAPSWKTERIDMQKKNHSWHSRNRVLLASAATLVLLVTLLALPPVRALADQLLQVFRVQNVVFVPVSSERIAELEDLDFDGETLFMSEPEVLEEGEQYDVATIGEAADKTGYALHEPEAFPAEPISSTISVYGQSRMQFQVNVESARTLLEMMEIDDVTLPDELGDQPITFDMPPSAMIHYYGENYEAVLVQGQSPDIALPEGVDMAQIGTAGLRLFGMDAEQAEALSQQVDWGSTLIFPFPEDLGSIRQVTVGDDQGLLTNRDYDRDGDHAAEHHHPRRSEVGEMNRQLYWQDGERFYILMSSGWFGNDDLVSLAESVR